MKHPSERRPADDIPASVNPFIPNHLYLAPSLLQIVQVEYRGEKMYCLADNMGFILPDSTVQDLLRTVKPFYELVSDGEIQDANAYNMNRPRYSSPSPNLPSQRKGYVYLIQCGPYYKIGVTSQIEKRLTQLATLPPFDIELIHTVATNDMYALEKKLHERFAVKRKNGEWFELDQNDVEHIKGL